MSATFVVVPQSPIYHTGYVVDDIDASIRHWVEQAGTGPFVRFDNFEFVNPVYRGQAVGPRVTLAFGYSGDTCIELIQPLDSAVRLIYGEVPGSAHHVGIGVAKLDEAIAAYATAGVECAFRASFAFGGGCAYLDTLATLGVFTELVERTPVVDGMLAQMRTAHREWNRRDLTFTLS